MTEFGLAALVQIHLTRYPASTVLDVYKLLHQGVYGPGHSIPKRKAAREWLDYEAGLTAPNGSEPMVESIHPQGMLVRVHIRPYLAHNGTLNALMDEYVKSADQQKGDDALMNTWWEAFEQMTQPGGVLAGRFEARLAHLMGSVRRTEHWAAAHHSPEFIRAYQPVYRVLTRECAESLCRNQRIPFAPV